jgi:hypothetical protein
MDYVDLRDKCRNMAEQQAPRFFPRNSPSSALGVKDRNAVLAQLFSDCMFSQGWTVAAPKSRGELAVDKGPPRGELRSLTESDLAQNEQATYERERQETVPQSQADSERPIKTYQPYRYEERQEEKQERRSVPADPNRDEYVPVPRQRPEFEDDEVGIKDDSVYRIYRPREDKR